MARELSIAAQDKKWEAESDARTLVEAEAIKSDPKKLNAAAKAAERMAVEEMKKAEAMKNIADIKKKAVSSFPKINRSVSKKVAVRATFPTVKDATNTVFQIMLSGIIPGAMEFLAAETVKAINRDRQLSMEELPTLLMEFNGFSERGLDDEMAFVEDICRENNNTSLDTGLGAEERDRLWEIPVSYTHLTLPTKRIV